MTIEGQSLELLGLPKFYGLKQVTDLTCDLVGLGRENMTVSYWGGGTVYDQCNIAQSELVIIFK